MKYPRDARKERKKKALPRRLPRPLTFQRRTENEDLEPLFLKTVFSSNLLSSTSRRPTATHPPPPPPTVQHSSRSHGAAEESRVRAEPDQLCLQPEKRQKK